MGWRHIFGPVPKFDTLQEQHRISEQPVITRFLLDRRGRQKLACASMRQPRNSVLPCSALQALRLILLPTLAAAFGVLKSVASGVPTEAELAECTDTRPHDCKRWSQDGGEQGGSMIREAQLLFHLSSSRADLHPSSRFRARRMRVQPNVHA